MKLQEVLLESYATTNPFVACNYLSWMDGAAYSDWSGLRPMTELEFEKACRGTATPVANEYAWGNTTATAATGISNGGLANETPSNSGANAVYGNSGTGGPLRVGTFANGSSTRAQSGASYYGIMELSGNLWERPVTVGNATGRAFTGVHGDGALSTQWPRQRNGLAGPYSDEVTGATGSGFRGGGWAGDASGMRASDRGGAAGHGHRSGLGYIVGFRGFGWFRSRVAPELAEGPALGEIGSWFLGFGALSR
jgi:formylglycine-generating enzyme required for sulfatase activity